MNKKTLSYNDYYGSIECEVDEGILHGKILHVRDLITYESDSLPGLKKEFEAAVDDYLETCKALGRNPDKPYSGTFNVRIGLDLHRDLAVYSANREKSLNLVVTEAIRAKLNPKVDELHVNHDHNVHHEHEIKVTEVSSSSSISNFDLTTMENEWQISPPTKKSFQKQH